MPHWCMSLLSQPSSCRCISFWPRPHPPVETSNHWGTFSPAHQTQSLDSFVLTGRQLVLHALELERSNAALESTDFHSVSFMNRSVIGSIVGAPPCEAHADMDSRLCP